MHGNTLGVKMIKLVFVLKMMMLEGWAGIRAGGLNTGSRGGDGPGV